MEADRSTTRTYAANTCELIVSGTELKLARADRPEAIDPVDFRLHLDRSEGSELDRLTLQGQPQQLNQLQQVVSSYIADLVAKFPIPVAIAGAAAREPEVSSGIERDKTDGKPFESVPPAAESPEPSDPQAEVRVDRVEPSSRSGILKNLPGLRSSLPADGHSDNRFDDRSGVSKMFGLQPTHRPVEPHPATHLGAIDPVATPAVPPVTPDRHTPYLTGSGDRSLDHYLHLGDLATATSGEVVSLSALQLFDLAIVLDEYANANLSPADLQKSATLNRTLFQSDPVSTTNTNTASVDPVRLSDFARGAADPAQYPVYYRNRRSRSAFMSGIPWAIAAALAVGVPLAMLDPNSNPLKDAANKLKMPDLAATKKSAPVPSTAPGATKTDLSKSNPNAALPTPWQTQPIQPPASTKPTAASTLPATSATGNLGAAPLPEALGGSGQNPATITGQPASGNKPDPNPISPNLNSSGLPIGTTTPQSTNKPGIETTPVTPSPKSGSTPKSAPIQIGQLPIDPASGGKISISKQPALLPPTDPSPSVTTAPVKPVPFPKQGVDESGRIDPFDRPTSKPAVATKPKPKTAKPQPSALNPSPNEPFTPVPKNPNLINPDDRSSTEGTDPQVQPVVPDRPLQSNKAADPAENNPTLQEAKRYFQGKWKASTTQPNALQYVLQVNKNGTVRSISPQGEAATTYLQQTKLIKTGQKLLSPAAGSSDQKIRVLLQPDGGVDTFTEP
jgi:Domain of unknown function (DUF4335)